MSYAQESGYYEVKADGQRKDTIQDAAEQLYKTVSALQERTESLRSRLQPLLTPEPPRDDVNARLTAVNNSSPFVGQLNDIRGGLDSVLAVVMEIERRLTVGG